MRGGQYVVLVGTSGVRFKHQESVRVFLVFFFSSRRRHTRFDCDWSSDVCSSDLTDMRSIAGQLTLEHVVPLASLAERVVAFSALHVLQQFLLYLPLGSMLAVWPQIGRASCRERV